MDQKVKVVSDGSAQTLFFNVHYNTNTHKSHHDSSRYVQCDISGRIRPCGRRMMKKAMRRNGWVLRSAAYLAGSLVDLYMRSK